MANPYRKADGTFGTASNHAYTVDQVSKQEPTRQQLFSELGVPTRRRSRQQVFDDYLPALSGRRAARVWREMSDNDATVGSMLHAIEMLIRELSWTPQPGGPDPADVEAADFLSETVEGLRHPWADVVSSALSMVPFGFAIQEIVYRRRDDGRVVWSKLAHRSQMTVHEWGWDEHGELSGFWQDTGMGDYVWIPAEKLVHYRTRVGQGPEGRSMLRNAYRSWWFKRRAEEVMGIGLERDLTGLPIAEIPPEIILEGGSEYQTFKDIVTRTKRDELEGITWPRVFDPETGEKLYEFRLLSSPGQARVDPIRVIRMWAADIASTLMADFMQLGRDAVGSRALAEPKQELFQAGLEFLADVIADSVNRQAVPRLFGLNTFTGRMPRLEHSPVRDINLAEVGQFMRDSAQAGVMWVTGDETEDDMLADQVRSMAGLNRMLGASVTERIGRQE